MCAAELLCALDVFARHVIHRLESYLLQWTNYQKTAWGTETSSEKNYTPPLPNPPKRRGKNKIIERFLL
jgi:hypothetical protein